MKKVLLLLLALMITFSITACGKENDNPPDSTSKSTGENNNETKTYGISEEGKTDNLSITIDKAKAPDPDILLNTAKEGYEFLQVYFTIKNISNETLETPKNKAIYIVYEEGETGDKSDMTSDDGSHVLPGDKDDMYRGYVELAAGESVSGWMLYQRLADQKNITMHYYSGFINKAPDLIFKFTIE